MHQTSEMQTAMIDLTGLHPIRIDDDLVAAAFAAVCLYLEVERGDAIEEAPSRSAWQAAALMAAQGGTPARGSMTAAWSTADRIGRAARWSAGILGTFD
ncbi:MAG: hypothetical protein ACUVSY_02805 [Roseiflexus sp.]